MGSLEEDIDELPRIREWLRGELFVTVLGGEEERDVYCKDELQEELWLALCEAQGLDPEEAEAVEGPAQSTPLGAGRMPWPGWVPLIALYTLRNRSVRPLIEALHPDPSSVDVGKFH